MYWYGWNSCLGGRNNVTFEGVPASIKMLFYFSSTMNHYLKCLLLAGMSCTLATAQTISWRPATRWITPVTETDTVLRPCVIFGKTFTLTRTPVAAQLAITAHGVYEATVNGRRVGNAYFTPGWTDYDSILQYQVYPVKDLLAKKKQRIEVVVGEGWYRGALGHYMFRDNYGTDAGLLLQLELLYADGSREWIVSDSTWQCGTGPILHSDIYGGELYDANRTTGNWQHVKASGAGKDNLVPTLVEPVVKKEVFNPLRVLTTPAGEQVIDFGQNIAGWVQCRLAGKKGDTVRLAHAEVLDKAGNFYTGNLRSAAATDTYVLSGQGEELLEPHFTWHGFRYVKVTGCVVNPVNWQAVALYSDITGTGSFECSDTVINRLQQNIQWSMKGNFLDIPTDCPQRSERLGWTGDAHVFFRAASFNHDVNRFFAKWLTDLRVAQRQDGSVPNIIPNLYKRLPKVPRYGRAGWGDAAAIIPWAHYWVYGDTAVLHNQYYSMKAWVDYIYSVSPGYLWKANGYGDWLAPGDSTSLPYIDQCFWWWSTQQLVNAAGVLGKDDDRLYYTKMQDSIRTAFLESYINRDGRAITHTQTAYVLALHFGLLPDTLRLKAAGYLAGLIRDNGNHLATGVLGTPYLLFALSDNGYAALAYTLLQQKTRPSWLYPVTIGATTIWERWDGIKEDGQVMPTSYNHYAYGAVGDWLYRRVAGIETAEAGYKKIIIRPYVGGTLAWVKASYTSACGKIQSNWKKEGNLVKMQVAIPAGATATVILPGGESKTVGAGSYEFESKVL